MLYRVRILYSKIHIITQAHIINFIVILLVTSQVIGTVYDTQSFTQATSDNVQVWTQTAGPSGAINRYKTSLIIYHTLSISLFYIFESVLFI